MLLIALNASLFAQRPNIVLVLLDDADKSFLPPFTPDYVSVPNIRRIYEEGARFDNCYGVYPLCSPSRYSLLTGMYPHHHGAIDNIVGPTNTSLPFFTTILQDAGYHNLCVGKYSNVDDNPPSFEKSMCLKIVDYTDPKFTVNGTKKLIAGNTTAIINDTMISWIASVDTPFFAWIGHIAPHGPTKPVDEDIDDYKEESIPIPSNAQFFEDNYPSFLYAEGSEYVTDTSKLAIGIERALEALPEIDRGIGDLMNTLSERGLLDNTMIVFTNDNGTFLGEHMLMGKGKPYEAAMALPLFVRYPGYFSSDSGVVFPQFVQSFDLGPTFLFAAGIDPEPYQFEGKSLMKQIANKRDERKNLYFEKIQGAVLPGQEVGTVTSPSWRACINTGFKYVRYHCDSTTEELFDMENDSLESTNLISDPAYAGALQQMRRLLDSKILSTHDTLSRDTTIGKCHLITNINLNRLGNQPSFKLIVSPQPANSFVNVSWAAEIQNSKPHHVTMELMNSIGVIIRVWNFSPTEGVDATFDVRSLPRGLYFVRATAGNEARTIPLLLQ